MSEPSDPNSSDNAVRGDHRSDPTTTMSPGPSTTTAHASPISAHNVRRRGLTLGLATLALIGIAILWTAWPAVREPVHRKDEEAGSPQNSRVLPPREIASRARRATVQIRGYDIDKRLEGEGTGFFVSSDGVIATNLHVIDGAYSLEIETLAGDVYDVVYFVTADARRDIAILKVPADDVYPLPLATDSTLDVGESVYVMGNPLGQTGTFSDGLVSARRTVEGVTLVQITAPVSQGSSGGPVMNSFGNVVGITTLMLRGGQNLNYAVPVRYLRPLVKANEPPRRYARNLLPSASTGLAAIETPTRETRGGRAPSRDRGTVDVVAARFRTADSLVRTIGGAPVSQIVRGRLENREWSQHPVTLVGGHEYVIAGYCDQDCTDLDLVIYTPAGTILDSDTDYDDYPKLRFVAPESGSYQLTVTMASCETNPCAYGIRLYRVQAR